MRAWLRSFLFFTTLFFLTSSVQVIAHSATTIEVIDPEVEYVFGGQITFSARINSQTPIEQVTLFYQVEGEPVTEIGPANLYLQGRVISIYDTNKAPMRVFSDVAYWYQINLEDGSSVTSPEFGFYYEDNRFEWQTTADGVFRAHWYSDNPLLAQKVLEVSQEGLRAALNYVLVLPPDTINIYIYDNTEDMQISLRQLGRSLVAGHADPAMGVVLVALPPGPDQTIYMKQRIPHEIMHILTYQVVGDAYSSLPPWLIEGLATLTELHPNQEYQVLLEDAHRRNNLVPISSLCQLLPMDASGALTAYAQSASFTQFLHENFGTQGIMNLLTHYSSGLGCEQGVEQAFGTRLNQLENQWRRDTFSGVPSNLSVEKVFPWVVLMVVVLFAPIVMTIHSLVKRVDNDR